MISLRKSLNYNSTIKLPDTDMLQELLQNPDEAVTNQQADNNNGTTFKPFSNLYSITIHNVENGFVIDAFYSLENIHKFFIANSLSDLFNIISGLWGKEDKDREEV